MSFEGTPVFALVRDSDDLDRACREMSDLLAFRRRRGLSASPEALLGIWIDPRLVRDMPAELPVRSRPGRVEALRIRETVGVSGLWTLCWLDDGEAVSRSLLMEALVEASRAGEETPSGRFVPVFRRDALDPDVRAEAEGLSRLHPRNVLPPLYRHPHSGRLLVAAISNETRAAFRPQRCC